MKQLTFNIEKIRNDFPILKTKVNNHELTYLDSAATSLTPKQVLQVMSEYYEKYRANVHRGIYSFSEKATEKYEEAHQKVASLINANNDEIIFTKNTTESLNLLAYSLTSPLKENDEILITEMEHHSNLVPWQTLAKEKKLKLKFIPVKNYELDYEAAERLLTKKTRILSVTHMSNVLGTINDVKRLSKLAHKNNTLIVVDAAQSAPHIPIDVKSLDVDFLAFSSHKMFGPTGIGVLYGKKKLLESLKPFLMGGGTIKEVTFNNTIFADTPNKFEAGTPAIAEAIGLGEAVSYLKEINMEHIHEYESHLTEYALDKLSKIPKIKIYGPKTNRGPVISFNLEGIHPHDVSEVLDKDGIAIRAGHMCCMPLVKNILKQDSMCRLSLHIYNTEKDIDNLCLSLKKAIEVFK